VVKAKGRVILKLRDASDFKYDLYVSTAKIDRIYDQMRFCSPRRRGELLSTQFDGSLPATPNPSIRDLL